MSGSTRESITTDYYHLALETPNISFEPDPETGESGEQEFHADASKKFKRRLSQLKEPVAKLVDEFARKNKGIIDVIKYDSKLLILHTYNRNELAMQKVNKCRVEFQFWGTDLLLLELSFKGLPSGKSIEKAQGDLAEMFKQLPRE